MAQRRAYGSLIFVQPTVPHYREGFFHGLHDRLGDRLVMYASRKEIGVISGSDSRPDWEMPLGNLRPILPGIEWQAGVMRIPITGQDIVVVSGAPRCVTNIGLLMKARRVGAKTIWWGHYWTSTSSTWGADLRMWLLRWADCALFYTDREVDEFRKQFPGRTEFPVFALNNGIDNREIKKARSSYTASEREKRIFFIGRFSTKSQFEVLLHALAHEGCVDVRLDVIGDGDALPSLRDQAEQLRIGERVVWHGGIVDETRIAAIANRCRVFVYPGEVGLSLIHALSYGLPVIVHNDRWTHMPEIAAFEEGGNGVSFEKGSAGSLTDAIAGLIADDERLETMSRAAIALTNKSYNTDDMVERFIRTLDILESR